MTSDVLIWGLGALMAAAGIGAVATKSLLVSVILSGGVSLAASLVFLLMGAPDVAMTEAAIGSGLTTVVFLYALARSRQADHEDSDETTKSGGAA
jgi:energy-converting hydrogenase B subunit D